MSRCFLKWLMLLLMCIAPAKSYAQVLLGQKDTFQDSTLQNWTNGLLAGDPVNKPTGGPAGAGDRYLEVSSGSLGGGPRSIVYNRVQWTGNYLAAGVTSVEMDLANFGASSLSMRFALRSGTGNSATPGYVSTVAFSLPADGVWRHAVFNLDASNLTALNSPLPLATFLTSVAEARVLDSASPSLLGDAADTRVGMDNILAAAIAVPEPTTWLLIILCFTAALTWLIHLRRQRQLVLETVYAEPEEIN